jgi:sugar diacid utilization regulator
VSAARSRPRPHATAEPSLSAVGALLRVASETDDVGQVLTVAADQFGVALGLVSAAGEPLAHAPDDDGGDRALAVAVAAARHGLVAPPGWHIRRLTQNAIPLGFLSMEAAPRGDPRGDALVSVLELPLTDQLTRAARAAAEQASFMRRLVTERDHGGEELRREATLVGLSLAAAYWPALLVWRNVPPRTDVVWLIESAIRAQDCLALAVDGGVVVLHPADARTRAVAAVHARFAEIAGRARALAPASQAQAIVDDAAVAPREVSARAGRLRDDARFDARAGGDDVVVSVHQFALDRLLSEQLDADAARRFVEERLGHLIAWDLHHRGGLLDVLEAALDFPRIDQAAARCFMHRNTFRQHLKHVIEILGVGLDDPDTRLATHVALKLHRLRGD